MAQTTSRGSADVRLTLFGSKFAVPKSLEDITGVACEGVDG